MPSEGADASTVALHLHSNANVGIGTTSPACNLQIDTPAANNAGQGIRINRPSAGTNYHSVEFSTDGTVDWSVGQNSNDAFEVYENGASATTRLTIKEGGNVGINTTSPAQKLDVRGIAKIGDSASNGHLIGRKDYSVTQSFSTGLTVTLADHTACHVKVFISGDWSSHSSIAYVGEFFIQNGGDGYAEPGIILTEHDNLPTDGILSQIVDGTGDSFTIQFRANTSSSTSVSGRLCYHIMGDATAVS